MMSPASHPERALHVNLAAFADNLSAVQRRVGPAQTMLVLKDDAYGLGIARIVPVALTLGIQWFGAFDVHTAVAVRAIAGSTSRIFAWLTVDDADIRTALENDIDLGVGDADFLSRIADQARTAQRIARVHLKIDTGLHRNGIRPEEWPAVVAMAREYELAGYIATVGVWSHIAEASDADDDRARVVFDEAIAVAEAAGVRLDVRHLAASAAAFARPEFRYDLVRIGAFAYGVRSAGGPDEQHLGITLIAELIATVMDVAASGVTIGIGSLDGLPSSLAGRVTVKTPGGDRELVSIRPTESVVTPWAGASVGDAVTVFGPNATSATDLAEVIDTVGEEILLRVCPGVPRVYVAG